MFGVRYGNTTRGSVGAPQVGSAAGVLHARPAFAGEPAEASANAAAVAAATIASTTWGTRICRKSERRAPSRQPKT